MGRYSLAGLGPVPLTLLVPLWARARETIQERPILADWTAVATAGAMDFNFSQLRLPRTTQVGACNRTLLIDAMVRECLKSDPRLMLVNIGEGLDNRFGRVDNGSISCVDLDLPEVIEIRRRFVLESARHRLAGASVLDESWTRTVEAGGCKVVLVAEGVLMYLPLDEVRRLMARLARRFPGCELIFDTVSPRLARLGSRVELGGATEAPFRWGVKHAAEMERWGDGYTLVERRSVFLENRERFGLGVRLLTRAIPATVWSHSVNRLRLGNAG